MPTSPTMPAYSVAIRTLALNPELLRQELVSVFAQTLPPERVVIYIAHGYKVPDFRVGDEIYVPVPKGMVAQRAVPYKEITSDLVLLLDDDVRLAPDSAATLVDALCEHSLQCISPDTFANHRMSLPAKVFAAVSNLVLPHFGSDLAFRMHRHGAFSYRNSVDRDVYLSHTAAGPCSLWRRDALLQMRFADELWLDRLGFAYNDDQLEFFKLHLNGHRLGVHFGAGVEHVGGRTSSAAYHSDPQRYYKRALALYLVWHRSLMSWRKRPLDAFATYLAFWTRIALTFPAVLVASARSLNPRIPYLHIKGLRDGVAQSRAPWYKALPPYKYDS